MNWRVIMDWVLACSIFVVIIGFVIDIIKSFKDSKNTSSEHNSLSKEHEQLSNSIKEQQRLLEKDTQQIISQNDRQFEKSSDIEKEIVRLDRTIFGEIKRREAQLDNLSVKQQEAHKQVETFNFMFMEMSRLQSENKDLQNEINRLKMQNEELIEIIEQQKKLQNHKGFKR